MEAVIEAYLPGVRDQDFQLQIKGETYTLPSLNRLGWTELYSIYKDAKDSNIEFLQRDSLASGTGLPVDVLLDLSEPQIAAILDQWFERVGCTPGKIGQIVYLIEKASQEFNYDLRRIVGIDGIEAFLTLPLTDCVDIMEMLTRSETSAWTWAVINGYEYPLTREAITSTDVVFTTGFKVPRSYSRLTRSSDILDVDALETAQELAENPAAPTDPKENDG